jgi:hypothetical protein
MPFPMVPAGDLGRRIEGGGGGFDFTNSPTPGVRPGPGGNGRPGMIGPPVSSDGFNGLASALAGLSGSVGPHDFSGMPMPAPGQLPPTPGELTQGLNSITNLPNLPSPQSFLDAAPGASNLPGAQGFTDILSNILGFGKSNPSWESQFGAESDFLQGFGGQETTNPYQNLIGRLFSGGGRGGGFSG